MAPLQTTTWLIVTLIAIVAAECEKSIVFWNCSSLNWQNLKKLLE